MHHTKHATALSRPAWGTIFLAAALAATSVLGDGFRNPPEGAAQMGRAGTRLTQADDATAVAHNPANILDLRQALLTPTVTIGYLETTFRSPTGQSESTENDWRVLPGLFGTWPVADGRGALGLGIHLPYGQATEWSETGIFRYTAPHYAEMFTLNVSPVAAWRFGPVNIGAGLDLAWSSLEFRQNMPWLPLPAGLAGPGSRLTFEGDGLGVAAHAGATWAIGERQRLAVTYRLPSSITYEGDFSFDTLPPGVPPFVTRTSDFETSLSFPTVIAAGYGVKATDTLRLEVNVEWIEHSRNGAIGMDIGNNNALLLAMTGSTSLPQDWDDTWAFDVGADWRVAEDWTLRAGYTFLPTPVPDETLMSTLAEGDRNIIGVGAGYAHGSHRVDASYALSLVDDRQICSNINPALNGTYEFDSHLAVLTYSFGF